MSPLNPLIWTFSIICLSKGVQNPMYPISLNIKDVVCPSNPFLPDSPIYCATSTLALLLFRPLFWLLLDLHYSQLREYVLPGFQLQVSLLDTFVKNWLLEYEIELKPTYQHSYLFTYICESSESSDNESQFATKLKNWNCDQQQSLNINLIAKQIFWSFFMSKNMCHKLLP